MHLYGYAPWLALGLLGALMTTPVAAQSNDTSLQVALMAKSQVSSRHPDLFFRQAGIRSYEAGGRERALALFKRAAGFADKPSQAIVAAMYWNGDGIPQDRPLGYAWMDLAADRGYADLLAQREQYWAQLDAGERERAIAQGQQIYAEYSDTQGLRRLDGALRRELAKATGSRTGYGGNNLTVLLRDGASRSLEPVMGGAPKVLGGTAVRGSDYFSPTLWSAEPYAKLKDQMWNWAAAEMGTVDVGPLQSLPAPPKAATQPTH